MNERSRLGRDIDVPEGRVHTRDYLKAIGVPDIAPATAPSTRATTRSRSRAIWSRAAI